MAIATDRINVVTATRFEARAVRAALQIAQKDDPSKLSDNGNRNRVAVIAGGVALRRFRDRIGGIAISCGLAGALADDLTTGAIVVPRRVRRPDGSMLECDEEVSDALVSAARGLGLEPVQSPLVTSERILRGAERARWCSEGYAAADMETGLLRAPRVACVRVILDTPRRELSAAWENPLKALLAPRAWFDLPFFIRAAPSGAALAAHVLATALSGLPRRSRP